MAGARRVGVDVERIAARVRYPAIARASFTAAECDAVRDLRGFFTVLDAQGGVHQALGGGLQRPLDSFTVTVDVPAALLDAPGWTPRDVPVPPGYLAALAVEGEAASVRVLPWSPSQGVSRGHQPRTARR